MAQVFSCEFCKISQNTFFTEHLWATASETAPENSAITQSFCKISESDMNILKTY